MNNIASHPWQHLFEQIVAALKGSGRLTAAVLDYIEATLFTPDPDRLIAFLSDDADSERDSLLDLIFYPDQTTQLALEPLLIAIRCSADDEAAMLDRLIARTIEAQVRLPDGYPLVSIQLPGFIKSQFLVRLNVSWRVDPDVAAALETGVSQDMRLPVMLRMRNTDLDFTTDRCRFLCRFFERMDHKNVDYPACLDLVLPLLSSKKGDVDVYDLLVERKRILFRSLHQARRFEDLLRRSNMETLMLQGVRAPHVACDDLQREMRLIDQICLGTYGKTEAIAPPVDEPVRQVSDLATPEAAVKSLLR